MSKNKHCHHEQLSDLINKAIKNQKKNSINLLFNHFAKRISDVVGSAIAFFVASFIVITWALLGHYFHYSDTWQLIINTGTTIITFLVVFLIQNTQNRDTEILNIKIDELIKTKKGADNQIIDLQNLSDAELKALEKEYLKIKNKRTGE
jgi:low affinity Fe/Cu permease